MIPGAGLFYIGLARLFEQIALWCIVVAVVAFLLHCPIFKPWFGFRRPPGSRGRWFT